jgi:hypothetical protein
MITQMSSFFFGLSFSLDFFFGLIWTGEDKKTHRLNQTKSFLAIFQILPTLPDILSKAESGRVFHKSPELLP